MVETKVHDLDYYALGSHSVCTDYDRPVGGPVPIEFTTQFLQ
jgi:hypothetical protein